MYHSYDEVVRVPAHGVANLKRGNVAVIDAQLVAVRTDKQIERHTTLAAIR